MVTLTQDLRKLAEIEANSSQAQNAANWLSRQADWWHALPGIGPLTQIFIPTPVS